MPRACYCLTWGGLAVDRVESDAFGGRVVHLVTADQGASARLSCGVFSVSVKGLVDTRPRDIPYGAGVCGWSGTNSSAPESTLARNPPSLACWRRDRTVRAKAPGDAR